LRRNLLRPPKIEVDLGIEIYASQSPGFGGKIRCFPEDFIVEEILIDGSEASVQTVGIPKISGWGRYLLCVLIKKNWDTLAAVEKIAEEIGISPNRISIAGIKDTRALTAQHISISGVTPERMLKVEVRDLSIHPLRFIDEKALPHLSFGNKFQVLVRSIPYDSVTVERRVKDIMDEIGDFGGLPNYFGHQRFGTIRPVTHIVGRHLVKGDFEKAATTFLSQPSPYEYPEPREARKLLWDTSDYKAALSHFPKHLTYERLMLSYLVRHPQDFPGSFRRLPSKLCKLFVHAYQSFLFNKFLSQRIERGIPLKEIQAGDYVVELDENGLPTDRFIQAESSNLSAIKEEINRGRMHLAIPLIGYKQSISRGIQGEIEKEILEEEGVNPKNFHIEKMSEASASGSLRVTLTSILNFSKEEVLVDPSDPSKATLGLNFKLHRGAYATIFLREMMKPQDLVLSGF